MPRLVVALSMFASLTSAITYMGVPGTVYDENTSFVLARMGWLGTVIYVQAMTLSGGRRLLADPL